MERENMEVVINDPENMNPKIVEREAMEAENLRQDDKEPQKMEEELIEVEKDSILKFIEAVKEHKCIWDMQSEDYYNRPMYRAAWKSLLPSSEVPVSDHPLNDEQKKELELKGRQTPNIIKIICKLHYIYTQT